VYPCVISVVCYVFLCFFLIFCVHVTVCVCHLKGYLTWLDNGRLTSSMMINRWTKMINKHKDIRLCATLATPQKASCSIGDLVNVIVFSRACLNQSVCSISGSLVSIAMSGKMKVNLYGIFRVQNGGPLKAAVFGRTPRTCLVFSLHRPT